MDNIDLAILETLQANGRATAASIGQVVGLTVPAVLERMKKLRRNGIILQYTTKVDRQKLGFGLLAFVYVQLEHPRYVAAFRQKVIGYTCVLECHHIAGIYDYLLKVAVENTTTLEQFLTGQVKTLAGVVQTNTQIVLTTLKEQ